MSTNATIGLQQKDGTVMTITCHWDGYISWTGRILLESYDNEERIRKLIAQGDLSCLGEKIDAPTVVKKYGFDFYTNKSYRALSKSAQDKLYKETYHHTVAYHRDRGEDWNDVKPVTYSSINQIEEREYSYVFVPSKGWLVNYPIFNGGSYICDSGYVPLTKKLIKEKN